MRSHEKRRGGGQSLGTWMGRPQGSCGKGKFPTTSVSREKVAGMDASRAPVGQRRIKGWRLCKVASASSTWHSPTT